MITSLTRNWWVQLIRGVLALVLGITALVAPGSSLTLAVFLVAAFAIADGAMTITTGLGLRGHSGSSSLFIGAGALFIVLGLVVLFWPSITVTALVLLFAIWLIASGALLAYGASTLRTVVANAWIMGAVGVVIAVVGLGLALFGPSTIENFLPFAGWFGVIVGLIMIAVSLRLRSDAAKLSSAPVADEV
ncbi:HdeD family acid-resistance protein [Dietzia sp. NPDC055343]